MVDAQSCTIVVIGKFNPAIIQPLWLGFNNVVQPGEAETATVEVISQQITSFSLDWLKLQITQDRFSITTGEPTKLSPLRDVFIAIFELLPHTPISALGLNFSHFFDTPSEETWHKIGHTLAPKEFWNQYIVDPGLLDVTIKGNIEGVEDDSIRVSVKPNGPKKVRVDFNHHFVLPECADGNFREIHRKMASLVDSNWSKFIRFNSQVTDGIQAIIKP